MKQLTLFDDDTCQSKKSKKNHKKWHLYIDGASRKNPGLAGAGVCLLQGKEKVFQKGFYLGHKTNNQAEYLALLLGIFYAKKYIEAEDTLTILSDSELLIRQMGGLYQVKNPDLKKLYAAAHAMLDGITYTLCHVMREKNEEADAMANQGVDSKHRPPQAFITLLEGYGIHT